jgi:glyoxylase-like metal-dependent hydrolase (beta-lactamase superfamily II)
MNNMYVLLTLVFLCHSSYAWFPVSFFNNDEISDFKPIDSTKASSGMIYVYRIKAGTSNMYLLASSKGMILIDAGWPGFEKRVVRLLNRLHRTDLRLILITHGHFDHYGSAAAIRRLTGAVIAVHKLDEEFMAKGATPLGMKHGMGKMMARLLPVGEFFLQTEPTFANIVFDESFSLALYGIDGYVLHTPGHTYGSCSIVINNEIAFTGDLLCNRLKSIESQCFYAFDWNVQAYSLTLLKSLSPLRCYPGHGNRYIGQKEFLNLIPLLVD